MKLIQKIVASAAMAVLLGSFGQASYSAPLYGPKAVSISPDGKYIASVEFRSKTKLWRVSDKSVLWTFQSKGGGNMLLGANAVDISRDGSRVVFSDNYDRRAVVLDAKTGRGLKSLNLNKRQTIYAVRFSPDGTKVAVSGSKITIWNLADESVVAEFDGHKDSIRSIEFSPNSNRLVSGSWDNTVKLWDLETAKLLRTFEGHSDDVNDVVFSHDGKWIASGSEDKTFRIWDIETGEQIQSALAHTGGSFPQVNEVIFTKDDRFLITAGADRKIKLWDVESGNFVSEPYSPNGCVKDMNMSGNGEMLVIASSSCTTSDDKVSLNFVENFTLCCSNDAYEVAMEESFKAAKQANNPEAYHQFIEEYSNEYNQYYPSRNKLLEETKEAYTSTSNSVVSKLEAENNIDGLIEYLQSAHATDSLKTKALNKVLSQYEGDKKLAQLTSYLSLPYVSEAQKDRAITAIYSIVKAENNIAGHQWFIDNYPRSQQARESLGNIYRISFAETEAINTIEAYNDYIIAYPYSNERKAAEDIAYELEKEKFSSYFTTDAELARALSIKAKQIKRKISETDNDAYLLIVTRMTLLLENEFPTEVSTERHLENEEILAALKNVTSHLKKIDQAVAKIADNTTDLTSILKAQSRMMDAHFNKAAQDRDIAAKYTEQHRFWERYLKDQGL